VPINRRLKLFIVTNSVYNNIDYEDLKGVEHDAVRIKNLLVDDPNTALINADDYYILRDADSFQMRDELTLFIKQDCHPTDQIIFYFSGHGSTLLNGDYGFCAKDTFHLEDSEHPVATSTLRYQDVIDIIHHSRMEPLIIIDACYSGHIGRITSQLNESIRTSLGESYALITSSYSSATSIDENDGGLFTKAICSAAKNGSKTLQRKEKLTLQDLFSSLRESLGLMYEPVHPQMFLGNGLSDMFFVKNTKYKPRRERLTNAHARVLRALYEQDEPYYLKFSEIQPLGPTEYTTWRKLELWGLIEYVPVPKGGHLTLVGVEFVSNNIPVSKVLQFDPNTETWATAPTSPIVSITDYP